MEESKLFAGHRLLFGGLSNEADLAKELPVEFKLGNAWSSLAMGIFYNGCDTSNWKWKSPDPKVRKHQMDCFNGLLQSFEIDHFVKGPVAGWMLSEMLVEVPERIPLPEKEKQKI
jgi:hypothetical protein